MNKHKPFRDIRIKPAYNPPKQLEIVVWLLVVLILALSVMTCIRVVQSKVFSRQAFVH